MQTSPPSRWLGVPLAVALILCAVPLTRYGVGLRRVPQPESKSEPACPSTAPKTGSACAHSGSCLYDLHCPTPRVEDCAFRVEATCSSGIWHAGAIVPSPSPPETILPIDTAAEGEANAGHYPDLMANDPRGQARDEAWCVERLKTLRGLVQARKLGEAYSLSITLDRSAATYGMLPGPCLEDIPWQGTIDIRRQSDEDERPKGLINGLLLPIRAVDSWALVTATGVEVHGFTLGEVSPTRPGRLPVDGGA